MIRVFNFKKAVAPLALFLLALMLRLWCLENPSYIGDEFRQLPAALRYVETGHSDNTFWHHPPLGFTLLAGSINVFGYNPLGWRFKNIATGTISILFVYFLTRRFSGSSRAAVLAALMLAVDPLHLKMSGFCMEEVTATFFFFLAIFILLSKNSRSVAKLTLFSLAIGASLACKSYFLAPYMLLLFFLQWPQQKDEKLCVMARLNIMLLAVVPAAIVVFTSYIPWFLRGYDVAEFLVMLQDSLRSLNSMDMAWFHYAEALASSPGPPEWFVTPFVKTGSGFINNPFTWITVLPGAVFAGFEWFRRRDLLSVAPLLFFLSAYIPLLLVGREIFIYSATAIIPFGFMLSAGLIDNLLEKSGWGVIGYVAVVAAIAGSGFYLYPLAVGPM